MKNRKISMALHGLIDYLIGSLLIIIPTVLHLYSKDTLAFSVPGILLLTYSLVTDYNFGIVRTVSIRTHLLLDKLLGLILVLYPFVLKMPVSLLVISVLSGLALFSISFATPAQQSSQERLQRILRKSSQRFRNTYFGTS